METIGRLARRFGMSRSTLLYYDRIGLLPAPARSGAGYRRYGTEAARRLELIRVYRAAGVPLAAILEQRLLALQEELSRLRAQQDVIIRILGRPDLARRYRGLDRQGWTALLRAVGLDEAAMLGWHRAFERAAPEAHQDFLESIRVPPEDIRRIRRACRLPGS